MKLLLEDTSENQCKDIQNESFVEINWDNANKFYEQVEHLKF
jgi:hypothetical protein